MTRELTYREALATALREALAERRAGDACSGQDVGARGGAYGVTAGLLEDFGAGARAATPRASEAALVGVGDRRGDDRPAAGGRADDRDLREPGLDQLAHHAAPLRALSGGRLQRAVRAADAPERGRAAGAGALAATSRRCCITSPG